MKKLFVQIASVIFLLCFGNAFAGEIFCNSGWYGGDHGYDSFTQVVISDKPILSARMQSEADSGYKIKKDSQSATLSLSVGWGNKELYGSNAVLSYRATRNTKAHFAKANYAFARECLAKNISPNIKKYMEKASLNPKPKMKLN